MAVCGLINLNKPVGVTSRRAVNGIARLARPAKVGHAGTLDPLASGVLIVGVGGATRLIGYVQRMPKQYLGTFLLGRRSATEDVEGEVVEMAGAPVPTCDEIAAAARRFVGRIQQRPPAFSAIKVDGQRAYDLARRGKEVELAARPVDIYGIEVVGYRYPELVLRVDCGSGTYIRSLGRDLAESLGTAAVMAALVRTAIGPFRLEDAVGPEDLVTDNWLKWLQPPLRAVEYLPRVRLSADDATRLRNGLPVGMDPATIAEAMVEGGNAADWRCRITEGALGKAVTTEAAAIDPEGQLVGIVAPGAAGNWRTVRNLPTGGD